MTRERLWSFAFAVVLALIATAMLVFGNIGWVAWTV